MLSRSSEYAVQAALYLARHPAELVTVADIAEALDVPRNYLSKILHQLARTGVVDSQRGPHGGFRLGKDASELTLQELVQPFDPMEGRALCLLRRQRCDDNDPCDAHHAWKDVSWRIRAFFRDTTVADLVAGAAEQGPLELEERIGAAG
jgi:Rrf2 family protein